jgi:hypothetical protein
MPPSEWSTIVLRILLICSILHQTASDEHDHVYRNDEEVHLYYLAANFVVNLGCFMDEHGWAIFKSAGNLCLFFDAFLQRLQDYY